MARWCCLTVVLFLCAFYGLLPLRAQPPQVQNWTTEEGLPQNSVHALLQSEDGYLWLATENGVARFNGLRFRRFFSGNEAAFQSDDVCCIAEGRRGTVLFGTASGVVALDGGVFRRVAGVDGAVLSLQRERDGSVLVLTAGGLFRIADGPVAAPVLPGFTPEALGTGADGSALLVEGTSLFRLGPGAAPVRLGEVGAGVLATVEDASRAIWTASASTVEVRDTSLQVLHRWQAGRDLRGSRVESLQRWPGGVLVGTNRGAAVVRVAGAVEPVTPLAGNAVLSATMDREGDAWFGTDSGGVFALRQRSIAGAAATAGEPVMALAAAPDGTVWVGTPDAGLQRVRGPDVVPTGEGTHAASATAEVVLSLASDGAGGVWVGSPDGLDHLSGERVLQHVTAADGLPDEFVRSLLRTHDGTVWAGTRRGAVEVRDGHAVRVLGVADGLPSDVIGAMLEDRDGGVWIGTVAGLARWDGRVLRRLDVPGGAPLGVASLLQTGSGALWVGTGQGLFLLHGERLEPVNVVAARAGIAAMVGDSLGNLWLRTGTGLLRAPEAALQACAGQSSCPVAVRQFGVADGMPSVELPTLGYPKAALLRDGTLWFATRRGVAVVDPRQTGPTAVAPGIAVEEVRVDDRPVPLLPEIEVGAGRRRVAIGFAGLSLRAPGQVRYRYLLEGFDRDWSAWQAGSVAEYTNLPPGRFVLRVQAMSAEGVVSARDATVALRVRAPLYRRWWFYAGLLLLAALAAYGMYWLRLRRVRRDFATVLQERNRIAREIHDTLAQDFVAVSLQLEVSSQLLRAGATTAAKEQIDATRTLVREGIQDARESIWAIRGGDTEQTLPARLAAAVQRTEHATFLVTGAYRALGPSREREVFRIGKEALGNAAAHAQAAAIRVELLYSEDAVLLRVSDDGAGFDVAVGDAKAGHYGVRGMRERAAAMGATLTVQSAPGQGTCVELRLRA